MPKLALPDWRDCLSYAPLLQVDRALLCWEWLRRDPFYRCTFYLHKDNPIGWTEQAARFGLQELVDPQLQSDDARPIWRAGHLDGVLHVRATSCENEVDAFVLDRFSELASLSCAGGEEHMLLCDGRAYLRLDIVDGSVRRGPVRLHYELCGFSQLAGPLLTLKRFVRFVQTGVLSKEQSSKRTHERIVTLLRTADALRRGATQREIATVLLDGDAARPNWRLDQPSLRSRVQRLVRLTRQMQEGGYRALLR